MTSPEAQTDGLLAAALRDEVKDCCMNDAWRGRCCPYHDGFRDGLDAGAVLALRTMKQAMEKMP